MKRSAAKKMKQRSAGKPDIELGKRIRLRRVEQKISQAELGDKLGVSFQQVQKYEKGVNRVGAARLQQIATALDVPVTFFYDGDGKAREVESLLFLDSAFSLRLLRAYSKIKDQTVQRQLVSLPARRARHVLLRRRRQGARSRKPPLPRQRLQPPAAARLQQDQGPDGAASAGVPDGVDRRERGLSGPRLISAKRIGHLPIAAMRQLAGKRSAQSWPLRVKQRTREPSRRTINR